MRTWRYGQLEGHVERRLADFQIRVEHVEGQTRLHANRTTQRMLQWWTLPIERYVDHPDGLVTLERRMVRAAFEEATSIAMDLQAIVLQYLNPQPPEGPATLRVAS